MHMKKLLSTLLVAAIGGTTAIYVQQKFFKEWQYVQTYLIDHEHGDWYEEGLDTSPEYKTRLKAQIWKTTYHNFRALMNCINRLEAKKDQ